MRRTSRQVAASRRNIKKAQIASARKRRGSGGGMSKKKKIGVGIALVAAGAAIYGGSKARKGNQHPRAQALSHKPKRATGVPEGKMKKVYHITQKQHVESIKKTGIRAQKHRIDMGGGNGYAHVTTNVRESQKRMGGRFVGPNTRVLETRVNRHHLKPDTYEGGAPNYRIRPKHITKPITERGKKRARVGHSPFEASMRQFKKKEARRLKNVVKQKVKTKRHAGRKRQRTARKRRRR